MRAAGHAVMRVTYPFCVPSATLSDTVPIQNLREHFLSAAEHLNRRLMQGVSTNKLQS
jgi:hypothetical protein